MERIPLSNHVLEHKINTTEGKHNIAPYSTCPEGVAAQFDSE